MLAPRVGMVLARGQHGLTHEANCSSNQSWHDICIGKTGMGFAWVDKCVCLCWTPWATPRADKVGTIVATRSIYYAHTRD